MEKQVKTYIKALKKSINQERFLIRVAGLEYEVAQKLPQAAPAQENCGPGWERDSGRCGKTREQDQECQINHFTQKLECNLISSDLLYITVQYKVA